MTRAPLTRPKAIVVTSPAFEHGRPIPRLHTCEGSDASPALVIDGVPADAAALALVMDDPDAPRGTWTHWTVWDLPAGTKRIAEAADVAKLGGIEGTTSAKETGYHGPCPPSGVHRYFFRVFALSEKLALPRGASIDTVWKALDEHAVAWGELMGTYSREAKG